jgi:transcriptional regulator with AAA-type ATPase domain
MTSTDYTLTTPLTIGTVDSAPLLALSIAWHPDTSRVGEQFISTLNEDIIELSRFAPLFRKPNTEALPIGHGGISRDPIRFVRDSDGGITISSSKGRMLLEVNGHEIQSTIYLSAEEIAAGVIICLGRAVFLCLHWMRCLPKHNPVEGIIGVGSAAIMARDLIRLAASNNSAVLLLGEQGTEKEIAAERIHELGNRAGERLFSVNMAELDDSFAATFLFGAHKDSNLEGQALCAGIFAEAQNATLFLQEIDATPDSVQSTLLRILESNEYLPLGASRIVRSTARLITATDKNLLEGAFNQALSRRLDNFVICIAPLRERREDIGLLLQHILHQSDAVGIDSSKLPSSLISDLLRFDWPGNRSQLSNVFKRILLSLQMGEAIQLSSLVAKSKVAARDSGTANATEALNEYATNDSSDGVAPMQVKTLEASSLTQLMSNVAHEINTPIGAVKASGQNIADALIKALENLPKLFLLLDEQPRALFIELVGQANLPAQGITTREERALKNQITRQLEAAGVDRAENKARILVQLRAEAKPLDYLALLNHPESDFILDTANSLSTIINSTTTINTAVDRVSKIITTLKSFAQSDIVSEMSEIHLHENIDAVLSIYSNQIKQGTQLVRKYEDVLPVRCVSEELKQVWTHLIHNALQAMSYKGTLSICIKQVGTEVIVSITDSGSGIPDNIRGRIFEPFFTTQPVGEGAGLGLDIVKKIVHKHKGRIDIQTEVGVGSTFSIYLPIN